MKKILITGSNGLLGQKLIAHYQGSEHTIIATSRGQNRLSNKEGYTYNSMDICSEESINEVMEQFKPDVVINTAAMTNVDTCETQKEECWQLNVKAVEHLVKACQKHNTFLLHLSTDFIFDGQDGPYLENAEPNPLSFYGWSKLAAEKALESSTIKWAIARTVLVYGIAEDMSRSNIILWVKNSLENKKKINVVNDQWRTPTLAEDLAAGCAILAETENEGIYNVSGKDLLNPYQMAIKTANYFNLDKSLITEADGSTFTQTAKRPAKTGFNIDKIIKLGYAPKSFDEGIEILANQI